MSTQSDKRVTKKVLGEDVSYRPKQVMEVIIKKLGKQKPLCDEEVNFWRSLAKQIFQEAQIKMPTVKVGALAKRLAQDSTARKLFVRFSNTETESISQYELWVQAVDEVYRKDGFSVDAKAILAGFLAGHTTSVQLLVAADIIKIDPSG
jgi:uncharacterized protein YfaS (alpha-2-macroglobulin family)